MVARAASFVRRSCLSYLDPCRSDRWGAWVRDSALSKLTAAVAAGVRLSEDRTVACVRRDEGWFVEGLRVSRRAMRVIWLGVWM